MAVTNCVCICIMRHLVVVYPNNSEPENEHYPTLAMLQEDFSRIRHPCGSLQKGTKRPKQGCPVYRELGTSSFKHAVQARLCLRYALISLLKMINTILFWYNQTVKQEKQKLKVIVKLKGKVKAAH